ncbi:preprotein translocase, YajC subunit [Peptostreptococcaceae bacterium oral taxon 113 str. W5053]|nr:preprotein translocase, YajC subunit [Peptostreptococcaceae bacterium oral taxon 113 str. W5053]
MDQSMMSLVLMVGMLALFYFLLIRPQKKREKKVAEMRNSLKEGDKIITIGGIHGRVVKTGDDFITIEVGSGSNKTNIQVSKWAIGSNVTENPEEA